MPYIKVADREKYKPLISQALKLLATEPNELRRCKLFGYFTENLIGYYLGCDLNLDGYSGIYDMDHPDILDISFKISQEFNKEGIQSAGDLNYCVSAVLWGMTGCDTNFKKSGYAHRSFLKGILNIIKQSYTFSKPDNDKLIVINGVLSDIMDEYYRIQTTPYEDQKIEENGTVWFLGSLL